ncbi:MAG: hypothetical protein EZS28_014392 [Streblomastix strix]|uniref:CFA20 domain-containing protein n=1 Tax=Streblomastix strix TaxID=222440 RepID=A0A5J4W5Y4_9EUKA|nr:MAG: hypothetical protein EZS28_014392 [Streblomastix strix]
MITLATELFSAHGSNPDASCKTTGKPRRVFDREAKSNVFNLSSANCRLQVPKDDKTSLNNPHQFLVLQICIPLTAQFSFQIGVSDSHGSKRRLIFSTALKDLCETPLHARIPLLDIKKGSWVNACFDISGFTKSVFRQGYNCMDIIEISPSVNLRKIFSLRTCPPPLGDDQIQSGIYPPGVVYTESIPTQQLFPAGVKYTTQLFWYEKTINTSISQAQGGIGVNIVGFNAAHAPIKYSIFNIRMA